MRRAAAAAFMLLIATVPPAFAGQGSGKAAAFIVNKSEVGNAVLSPAEELTIRSYFDQNPGVVDEMAPLAPALRDKLAPGSSLTPEIAAQALPASLYRYLPRHRGLKYRMVGTDLVLVEGATETVVDVVKDVLGGS